MATGSMTNFMSLPYWDEQAVFPPTINYIILLSRKDPVDLPELPPLSKKCVREYQWKDLVYNQVY